MDYTIIGSAVNLTARLQTASEVDGILLGHETYSLVKDEVAAEEQVPIKAKGFAEPIRCYRVVGLYEISPARAPSSARRRTASRSCST